MLATYMLATHMLATIAVANDKANNNSTFPRLSKCISLRDFYFGGQEARKVDCTSWMLLTPSNSAGPWH